MCKNQPTSALEWLWKMDHLYTIYSLSSIIQQLCTPDRQHNQLADKLSKKGLQENLGDMHIENLGIFFVV